MTAVERGTEMLIKPLGTLPWLAVEFARHLAGELGWSGEVLLTAWIVYAQVVENLPCDDTSYQAREIDRDWFRKKKIIGSVRRSPVTPT